jgi:hypothetical protein
MTHVVAAVFGEKEACLLAHLAYISNPCAFFSTLPPRRPEVDAGRRETCRCRAGTGRSRRSKDSTPRRRRQLEPFFARFIYRGGRQSWVRCFPDVWPLFMRFFFGT